jgi:hypothetical protein
MVNLGFLLTSITEAYPLARLRRLIGELQTHQIGHRGGARQALQSLRLAAEASNAIGEYSAKAWRSW